MLLAVLNEVKPTAQVTMLVDEKFHLSKVSSYWICSKNAHSLLSLVSRHDSAHSLLSHLLSHYDLVHGFVKCDLAASM